jgi:hypothetical protein
LLNIHERNTLFLARFNFLVSMLIYSFIICLNCLMFFYLIFFICLSYSVRYLSLYFLFSFYISTFGFTVTCWFVFRLIQYSPIISSFCQIKSLCDRFGSKCICRLFHLEYRCSTCYLYWSLVDFIFWSPRMYFC